MTSRLLSLTLAVLGFPAFLALPLMLPEALRLLQAPERNLQKTKIQKYKEEIKSIEKSIILPKKSIFSGAELKMTIKKQKKNKIVRVVSIRPILKDESFGKVVPISHEYNEGVSIDTIKKSALSALNKPSYAIE